MSPLIWIYATANSTIFAISTLEINKYSEECCVSPVCTLSQRGPYTTYRAKSVKVKAARGFAATKDTVNALLCLAFC